MDVYKNPCRALWVPGYHIETRVYGLLYSEGNK